MLDLVNEENRLLDIKTNAETLAHWLFDKQAAEVTLAMINGFDAGFALLYNNFNAFRGSAGIYIANLYIKPQCRGHGIGTAMLSHLAKIAVERGFTLHEHGAGVFRPECVVRRVGTSPVRLERMRQTT